MADDTRGRDEGVREIRGEVGGTSKGKEQIILKPVERIGLQFSTTGRSNRLMLRFASLSFSLKGYVAFFILINSETQETYRKT